MRPYLEEDFEYALTRLSGSLLLWRDTLIEVRGLYRAGPCVLDCIDLIRGGNVKVYLKDLDPTPLPLGYVNHGKTLNYVARRPLRGDYKQGLRFQSLTSLCGVTPSNLPIDALFKTIKGEFPSFKECLESAAKGVSGAWNNSWGVDEGMQIVYKGQDLVGASKFVDGSFRVELFNQYQFMEEEFREATRLL